MRVTIPMLVSEIISREKGRSFMQLILEATYREGVLIPDRSLGPENEGKKFKLIVVEEQELEPRRDRFFQFVREHSFNLPEDYRFSREEIYDR